jgi:hypothetical protein
MFGIAEHGPARICRGGVRMKIGGKLLQPDRQGPDHDCKVWPGD